MNIKDIAALAEIVKQNELTKLEINGENIVIERAAQVVQAAPILNAVQPAVPEQMHTTEPIAEVKEKEGVYVKSSAVGVFYAAPSPDSKPFVAAASPMQMASSASATWIDSASALEYTATVRMPISLQARIMRTAISPRFAISSFVNIACSFPPGLRLDERKRELCRNADLAVYAAW